MPIDTLDNLRARATQITNETVANANNAARIGGFLRDSLDTLSAPPPDELANFDAWQSNQQYEYDPSDPTAEAPKVTYEGRLWEARRNSLNAPPDSSPLDWKEVSSTHAQNTDKETTHRIFTVGTSSEPGDRGFAFAMPGVSIEDRPRIFAKDSDNLFYIFQGGLELPLTGPLPTEVVVNSLADLQTALNAAPTTGWAIKLAPGLYTVTTTITVPAGVALRGSGERNTILAATAAITLIEINTGSIVEDLTVRGDRITSETVAVAQHGISVVGLPATPKFGWTVRRVRFEKLGGKGINYSYTYAINSFKEPGAKILDCWFLECHTGEYSDIRGEYVTVANCHYHDNRRGVHLMGGNVLHVGCNISCNFDGVFIGDLGNGGHGIFSACNINHNPNFAVQCETTQLGYTFNNCHVYQGSVYFKACAALKVSGGQWDATAWYFENTTTCEFVDVSLPFSYANTFYYDYNGGLNSGNAIWKRCFRTNGEAFATTGYGGTVIGSNSGRWAEELRITGSGTEASPNVVNGVLALSPYRPTRFQPVPGQVLRFLPTAFNSVNANFQLLMPAASTIIGSRGEHISFEAVQITNGNGTFLVGRQIDVNTYS